MRLAWLGLCGCSFLAVQPAPYPLPEHGAVECTRSKAPAIVDLTIGTAAAIAGPVLAYEALKNLRPNIIILFELDDIAAAAAFIPSFFPFGSAAHGFRETARCRDAPRIQAVVAADRRERTAKAQALTDAALAAARAGDCAQVKPLAAQVRAVDVTFYETVFATDATLAPCLAPPSTLRMR